MPNPKKALKKYGNNKIVPHDILSIIGMGRKKKVGDYINGLLLAILVIYLALVGYITVLTLASLSR